MKNKFYNRILSGLIAVAIAFAAVPASVFFAAEEFTPENLLINGSLESVRAVGQWATNPSQIEDMTGNRITEEQITDIIEGKENGYTYFMDALGWDPPRYVGLEFVLNESQYIGEITIDAGYENREEIYDIYVSDSIDSLYSSASKVAEGVSCLEGLSKITVNKSAKYAAIICTSCKDGGMRIKQIKVMSGEEDSGTDKEFVSENLLIKKDALVNSKAICMLTTDISQVEDATGNRINAAGISDIINGNASGYTYVMDALGWNPPKYVGLTFGFDTSYYIGDVTIDAGYESREEIYDIYVSDSESTLYSESSRVATGVTCLDGATTVTLNRSAKYISIVCTYCRDGGMRIKQISVMSAEQDDSGDTPPADDPVYDTTVSEGGKKVLTIGNSFSENAAEYATEIAANQGYDLLFGYLKYPSATIEQHISNAERNRAVYKFEFTSSNGRFTVKDGQNSFATVKDALEFTDWDIIVLQQGSTASEDFNTYLNIAKLIEYAKGICPNAEIMLHETWSWGIWSENGDERCYKIMANYLAASKLLCENATVIHSGLAVEKVREHYGNHLMLNDEDNGNYQHLNSLGKYIAGAAYVATVFGGDITVNTYGDGEEVFESLDLDAVRSIIADAVNNGDRELSKKYEDYLDQLYDKLYGVPDNFIDRHLSKAEGIVQDVATGGVDVNSRFGEAVKNSGSSLSATDIAIDGDTVTTFEVWGALDWDPPKNVGVRYTLDGTYKIDTAEIYVGKASDTVTIDVYAAKANDSALYNAENLVGKGIVCNGEKVTVDIGAEITDVAFIITDYTNAGNTFHVAEFDLIGSDDKIADNQEQKPNDSDDKNKEKTNFIAKHLSSFGGIVEDVGTGAVDTNDRFGAAVSSSGGSLTAEELAIDGDTSTAFDVWGALDWDPPKNVGVRYALDAIYKIDTAVIYAGNSSNTVTFDVYAAKVGGPALYQESNLVGKDIVCNGGKVTVDIGFEITEIAFIITGYSNAGNTAQIAEFDLTGAETQIPKEEFKWPQIPDGNNILKDATAFEIIAPGGDYRSSKEYDYGFMDYKTETELDKLVDGNTEQHYDIWSLRDGDKPGVLYDLGAYYDVTHLHAWAGVFQSDLYTVNGYRIYASDSLSTLYQDANAVFVHENEADTTNEAGANVNLKRVRYIAFIITQENGGWKLRELAAYGTKSADQSQPAERESIIAGLDAEYYGVATDNLYDPIYMGASEDITALVDGKRENVELWGGNDVNNSCFVIIYNLYANYDLSDIEIFANADYMDTEFNVHKGIKSAKVYASRKFDGLFSTTPMILKDGYAKEGVADEVSSFAADALSDWKAVRYVAFVFTIDDTQYGACRLEEIKVYGKMSAVQDAEEEEARLPQYIDIKAENGVVARIFAMNATDDLAKLGAHLESSSSTEEVKLNSINNALKGYNAEVIYYASIVDINGNKVDTDGRFIRLSFPKNGDANSVACVDDFGAEIVSNGVLNEFLTVETATLRSYALVTKTGETASNSAKLGVDLLWIAVISLGVLAGCGIGLSVLFGLKMRKY